MIPIRGSPLRFFSLTIGLAFAAAIGALAIPIAASAASAFRPIDTVVWPAPPQAQLSAHQPRTDRSPVSAAGFGDVDFRLVIKARDSPLMAPVSRAVWEGPLPARDDMRTIGIEFVAQPRLATAEFHRLE